MRELLEAVASGELSPAAAEAKVRGYVTNDAGRFDAARERRAGVPEAILATGKTTDELTSLVEASVESTDRAILTRVETTEAAAIKQHLAENLPDANVDFDERGQTLVAHTPDFDLPDLEAEVGIVTAGTSDAMAAGEAATILREMGVTVERINDVGVASLSRLLDQVPTLREQDLLIVAAGREGALPTVIAGLVDVPIIGLPVSTGYGHGGDGEAALSGMLQSCTALSVVNIDAGFTAGVQAGLFARKLDEVRSGTDSD